MRNVRNFWVKVNVDGKKTGFASGPRSADGGMTIRVLQRSNGRPSEALEIDCRRLDDGTLVTSVTVPSGETLEVKSTR